jgi:hypothetical protein
MSNLSRFQKPVSLFVLPIFVICLNVSQAQASAENCSKVLDAQTTVTFGQPEVFQQGTVIRFLQYNVENFFMKQAAIERGDVAAVEKIGRGFKSMDEINKERDIIANLKPHFITVEEMHDIQDAKDFVEDDPRLQGKYQTFLTPGNDIRGGINIAMYATKSFGFNYEYDTHKDVIYKDPVTGLEKPLFSRDTPVLIARKPGETKPSLIVIGAHLKSKRVGENSDAQSDDRLRKAQSDEINNIIAKLQAQFGADVNIIFAGDLQTDPDHDPDLAGIRQRTVSVFDNVPGKNFSPSQRYTEWYFGPNGAPGVGNQIDDIRTAGKLQPVDAEVVPYLDDKGQQLPPPTSYQDRQSRPSDHNPVFSDIKVM